MEMFVPLRGRLRRTNFEGVEIRAAVSENERSLNAKIGYVQVCEIDVTELCELVFVLTNRSITNSHFPFSLKCSILYHLHQQSPRL